MSARSGGQLEFLNQIREKSITVDEQEALTAGTVAVAAGTDAIPFSSLSKFIATLNGAELGNVVGGNDTHQAVAWIFDNIALCGYNDADSTNDGTVTPVRLNADGSKTVGSNFVFDSGAIEHICLTSVNNGRLLIGFEDSGVNQTEAIAGEMDRGSMYIRFGASTVLEAVDTDAMDVTDIRDDAGVFIYNHLGSDGNLIAVSVNTSTLALTKGAIESIGTGAISWVTIEKLTTDKIICGYRDAGAANDGFSNVATVSTVTLTVGGDTEFSNNDNAAYINIAVLTAALAAVGYTENGVTGDIHGNSATISGTTPAFGTPQVLNRGAETGNLNGMIRVNDSTFMALWDLTVVSATEWSFSTVVTTTVTPGTEWSRFANDFGSTFNNMLVINEFNDIVFFGIFGAVTYAVFMDLGFQDSTYELDDILGVAADSDGKIIIDGIDEGNASGENPAATYFWDGYQRAVRLKSHSCQYPGYIPRVRVVAPDALMAIGG